VGVGGACGSTQPARRPPIAPTSDPPHDGEGESKQALRQPRIQQLRGTPEDPLAVAHAAKRERRLRLFQKVRRAAQRLPENSSPRAMRAEPNALITAPKKVSGGRAHSFGAT